MLDPLRIDLPEFLTSWYGPPENGPGRPAAEASRLPGPLREWFALADRWPGLRAGPSRVYEPSRIRVEDGRAVFLEDPTGDWRWSFDAREQRRVYEGEPGRPWHDVREELPEFLVHLTLAETVASAGSGRLFDQAPDETLPVLLAPMREVAFGGWRWPRPGYRIFLGDSLVANVGPAVDPRAPWQNRAGYSAVRITAARPPALGYLDGAAAGTWIDLGEGERG